MGARPGKVEHDPWGPLARAPLLSIPHCDWMYGICIPLCYVKSQCKRAEGVRCTKVHIKSPKVFGKRRKVYREGTSSQKALVNLLMRCEA
jgi:hypothetical protein